MTKIIRLISFILFLALPTFAQTLPASQPAELLLPKEILPSLGQVHYQQADQRDEIICVLQNGMTVICKRISSPVLAVRVRVGTGGIYEGKWLGGGLSHLLEHLVAGGSSERRTEEKNKELLQKIGNNSNAFTTENHTDFFIDTTPDHLDESVDLLSGWVLGALITPNEYRREYQVVQRELEMGKGEPDRQFWYLSQMNRYRVSPARVPVIGYQEVIQGLSRDDVFNYYKMAYVPQNMIFSLAGDLDPQVMLAAVQKYVGDAKPGRVFEHNIPIEPPVTAPRSVMATFPKLGQAQLGLAFPSVRMNDADMYPLDLLATILGDGDSSVLVEELRDKQQLVSSVSAEDDTPSYDRGSFDVIMQLDPTKIPAATAAVNQIIEEIKTKGVSAEQLDRAKTQVRVAHARSQQTAESVAETLADDLAETGDVHSSDRYVEREAAVTAEDVQRVAREYLQDNRLITTALLPAEYVAAAGLPSAEDLIRPAGLQQVATVQLGKSEVRRTVLDDGTIVLLKRVATSPLVSIQMFALGGMTAEDAQTNGLGNLTMNLAMRGTTTRSAQQIAQSLDSMGAELGTATNNNTWSWQGSCLRENLPQTLDIFADVFKNANFPDSEIDPMKARINAAITGEDSIWNTQAVNFFKKTFFGPDNSPYQFNVLGTPDNLKRFDRGQIVQWYKSAQKSRRVLAIYGDIDVNETEKLLQKNFQGAPQITDNIPPTRTATTQSIAVDDYSPATIQVERVAIQPTQQALAGVVIGFEAKPVIGDPSNFVLDVGQTLCGGYSYPAGYLFEILRGRGLVYVVQAENRPGQSSHFPGAFLVLAGCQPSNVNEVVETIIQNIARLQGTDADMQVNWFQRAKRLIVTADALENETPEAQGELAALDELYGLGYKYHQQFADSIGKVTLEEIRQIARRRLSRCIVTICTPEPQSVSVQAGERRYTNFPAVDLTPRGVQHGAVR
jgi:zinc protease